jgi:hypothetical protein
MQPLEAPPLPPRRERGPGGEGPHLAHRCTTPAPSGSPCLHPAPCPRHTPIAGYDSQNAKPETQNPAPATVRLNHLIANHFASKDADPRRMAADVLKRVVAGTAAPLQAARFLRAGRLLTAMGQAEMDDEAALAEAEFRGRISHGLPPRDDDEWEYARLIYNKGALEEFARWAIAFDAPFPDDINPPGGRTREEQWQTREALNRRLAEKDAVWKDRSRE